MDRREGKSGYKKIFSIVIYCCDFGKYREEGKEGLALFSGVGVIDEKFMLMVNGG